jgi:Plavaka transposase
MAFQMVPDHGTMKGAPGNEVTLFYRDPLKAIQSLLDRSSLAEHMEFAPYRLYQQKNVENDGSGSSQHTRSDAGQEKGPDDGSEEQSENGSGDGPDSRSDIASLTRQSDSERPRPIDGARGETQAHKLNLPTTRSVTSRAPHALQHLQCIFD